MHQDDINGINALYGIAVSTSAYEFDFLMISNPYQKSLGLLGQYPTKDWIYPQFTQQNGVLIRPLFTLTEQELCSPASR